MSIVSLRTLIKSFSYAGKGVKYAWKNEQNFRIHIFSAIFAVMLMLIFPLMTWERVLILLIIMFILVLELINTTFEKMADVVKPRIHSYVEVVKDLMAAAVLFASLGAAVIGLLIFVPYFVELFR